MILLCALFILQRFNDKKVQVHKALQIPLCFMRWIAFLGWLGTLVPGGHQRGKNGGFGCGFEGKKNIQEKAGTSQTNP